MIYKTTLEKMKVKLLNNEVQYYLKFNNDEVLLNNWINQNLKLKFLQSITCMGCGVKIKKSYSQGYCYLCFTRLAQNDICFVKPELCHHHNGTCRQMEWGSNYCFSPHIIYLSLTSEFKVGITKQSHFQTRWIDQGATKAIALATLSSRFHSGLIEKYLKDNQISDKTNWRVLLKENSDLPNEVMYSYKENIIDLIEKYLNQNNPVQKNQIEFLKSEITEINYPGELYQQKSVRSINLDKDISYQGKLVGIKGQYFIFEDAVINIRKYGGYEVQFENTDG